MLTLLPFRSHGQHVALVIGGLLSAPIAFSPSFVFVRAGAHHFDRLRTNADVQAFLAWAGPEYAISLTALSYTYRPAFAFERVVGYLVRLDEAYSQVLEPRAEQRQATPGLLHPLSATCA